MNTLTSAILLFGLLLGTVGRAGSEGKLKLWGVLEYAQNNRMYSGFFKTALTEADCIKQAHELRRHRKKHLLPYYDMECVFGCELKDFMIVCEKVVPIE